MTLDVTFEESNQSFEVQFGELHNISDGGFEQGYAEGEIAGYEKGKTDGITEGVEQGKKSEYDRFWDTFQKFGGADGVNYYYAFSNGRFTDDNYNPKYPIYVPDGTTTGSYMFYRASFITDTKVPIYANGGALSSAFRDASRLVTIPYLYVVETITYSQAFASCMALKNITMGGTIGNTISFQWSPLTVESMKSIISALKNFTGTGSENTCTITFNDKCWAALEADSTAPDGGTWKVYVTETLRWNA